MYITLYVFQPPQLSYVVRVITSEIFSILDLKLTFIITLQ